MKKLFYIFTALCLPTFVSAQLQNLDFENWDSPIDRTALYSNNPTGWLCNNGWFGYEVARFSNHFMWPIDTNAQHNQYALYLLVWYNHTKDAAFQTAPINYRPSALKGFYKYEDNFIINELDTVVDTAQVIVMLSKWNATEAKRDTIGFGKLDISKANSVFKELQVNINYVSAAEPDSILIFLDPSIVVRDPLFDYRHHGGGGTCSYFTIDNLSLVSGATTGINDITPNINLNVHPNPTADRLQFEAISGSVSIFDITGQCVLNQTHTQLSSLDVSHLNKGIYFMIFTNEEGNHTTKFVKR